VEPTSQVGAWLVKPRLNPISAKSKSADVEPKVIEVLVCLAEQADEVVEQRVAHPCRFGQTRLSQRTCSHARSLNCVRRSGMTPRNPRKCLMRRTILVEESVTGE
jgi:hypothetical protein